MNATEKKTGLNANQLKLIAIAAMTLDHLTWTLWPGNQTQWFVILFHVIGRLTAPTMWFFIAEGYYHTHDVKKYAGRLFSAALVSHFAYTFCFGIPMVPFQTGFFNQTSTLWPLAWGLVLLYVHDRSGWKEWQKLVFTLAVCVIAFPSDHSCVASMAILYIGLNRGNFHKQMEALAVWSFIYAAVFFFFINKVYAFIQLGNLLVIPLLAQYNGQRGERRGLGKLFYAYYPAHLALCGLLRVLLWGVGYTTTGVTGI